MHVYDVELSDGVRLGALSLVCLSIPPYLVPVQHVKPVCTPQHCSPGNKPVLLDIPVDALSQSHNAASIPALHPTATQPAPARWSLAQQPAQPSQTRASRCPGAFAFLCQRDSLELRRQQHPGESARRLVFRQSCLMASGS